MSAHSPGPWRITGSPKLVRRIHTGDENTIDTEVACIFGSEHSEADAHLIAAAPDLLAESRADETFLSELLAALNKATELGATRVDVGDLRVAVEHRLKPLRAAIAKADGAR